LNSTQDIMPAALADEGTYEETLELHRTEFFMSWNVKAAAAARVGSLGFHAAGKHARLVDRRRVYELLRPLDAGDGPALLGRGAISASRNRYDQ